jgi:hypothetical protein
VNSADLESADILCVLEGISQDTLTGLSCDKLDALDDTINNNVLNARVLSLSVLSDKDGINVIVWGLIASNGTARSDVGEEIECAAKSKIERNMAFSNWGL